jgi:hypothetical protein
MFVARKIGSACRWSLTSLREKLIMIGDKIIAYARYTVFQMAEAAVPRDLFRRIMELIDGAQAMGRGTMLTATVGPDLRAFRQQKCVRAAAKPAEMTWRRRERLQPRGQRSRNTPVLYSPAWSMSLSCRQIWPDFHPGNVG